MSFWKEGWGGGSQLFDSTNILDNYNFIGSIRLLEFFLGGGGSCMWHHHHHHHQVWRALGDDVPWCCLHAAGFFITCFNQGRFGCNSSISGPFVHNYQGLHASCRRCWWGPWHRRVVVMMLHLMQPRWWPLWCPSSLLLLFHHLEFLHDTHLDERHLSKTSNVHPHMEYYKMHLVWKSSRMWVCGGPTKTHNVSP